MIWVDKQPFIASSDFVESSYYDQEFGPITIKGKKKNGAPIEIYIESTDTGDIRDQATKLLKTTIIVPFRPTKG